MYGWAGLGGAGGARAMAGPGGRVVREVPRPSRALAAALGPGQRRGEGDGAETVYARLRRKPVLFSVGFVFWKLGR